jgi:quercetin dioxygenase-like cupin family protein
MTTKTDPINAVGREQGEALWFNGALMNIKSPGDWSEGGFSLVEVAMESGRATGLHTDPCDETFYILEGELLFHVDGDELRAGAGETVGVRRGVPHAFIATAELTRFLVLNAPGTHDSFFREGGHPAADRDFANAPGPDLERTRAAGERVGVDFLGPPPFDGVRLQSG